MHDFLTSQLRILKRLIKQIGFFVISVLLTLSIFFLNSGANFVNAQDADLHQNSKNENTIETAIKSEDRVDARYLNDKEITSESDDILSLLQTIQSLQEDFAAELAALRGRVDALEVDTAELRAGGTLVRNYCFRAVLLQVTGEPNDDVFRCLEESTQRS